MSESNKNLGTGFASLLTIVFITLKLINEIDWSWVWVLSPLWIGFALSILFLLIVIAVVK